MRNIFNRGVIFTLIFIMIFSVVIISISCARESADLSTGDEDDDFSSTPEPSPSEIRGLWFDRAEESQDNLLKYYWDSRMKRMKTDKDNNLHYWWQAHALDTLFDAFARTGDEKYADTAYELYKSIYKLNGNTYINDFYDDMEWMALALLRGHVLTNNGEYLDTVKLLWTEIKKGWNDTMGGGIAWQKNTPYYKNTPANMPAAILAARLYRLFGHEEDLEWAVKIYDWQVENLVSKNGLVWDGMNRNRDGKIDTNWLFTYCQGVFIGASVELHYATSDDQYLDAAIKTAERSMKYFSNAKSGIVRETGEGDGGLFKGIFVRYLVELALVNNDENIVDFLVKNASSVWDNKSEQNGAFSDNWAEKASRRMDLSVQLSGTMMVEMVARLEREGLLVTD